MVGAYGGVVAGTYDGERVRKECERRLAVVREALAVRRTKLAAAGLVGLAWSGSACV